MEATFYLVACDSLRTTTTGTREIQPLGNGAFWDWAENCATQAVSFGLVPRPFNPDKPGTSAIWIVRDLIGSWGLNREFTFA